MTFAEEHPEATVAAFSAWGKFQSVLEDPEAYGFKKRDTEAYGAMWCDDVHPTSAMHKIVAMDIANFLYGLSS
jgi:phospholipase/lecithinase/hemolysin